MQTLPEHVLQRTRVVAFGWNPRVPLGLAVATVVLLWIVFWAQFLNDMNSWFSVRWLKYQVTRNADPTELRQWATNLLARHGNDLGGYQDFYGTNLPSGLRKVKAGYPSVRISQGENEVTVFADRKGAPFLVISPSSVILTPPNDNIFPWQPDIYFVRSIILFSPVALLLSTLVLISSSVAIVIAYARLRERQQQNTPRAHP
jgi:hypothetical protein